MEKVILINSLILGFATLCLAVINFFYMMFTKKMSKAMQDQTDVIRKEFNLSKNPLLDGKVGWERTLGAKAKLRAFAKNRGRYPFYLQSLELRFFHADHGRTVHVDNIAINRWFGPNDDWKEVKDFDYAEFPEFEGINEIQGKTHVQFYFVGHNIEGEHFNWPSPPSEGGGMHNTVVF
jgi:hypothetical protein